MEKQNNGVFFICLSNGGGLTQRNTAEAHNYSQLNLFEMVYKSNTQVLRIEENRKHKPDCETHGLCPVGHR
jgi:hypothetical protein